jgi:uncharacterized membrane protein
MPIDDARPSRRERWKPARAFWKPERLADAIRSGALLALIGASLPLLVWEAIGRTTWLDPFLTQNHLGLRERNRIILWMGAGAEAFLVVAALLVFRRGPSDESLERARRTALVLSPVSLLCLILPLFRLAPWEKSALVLSCSISIVVLVFEQMLSGSLASVPEGVWQWFTRWVERVPARAARIARWIPLGLVVTGALAYGVLVTVLTIRYHDRLGTAAFDLGGYDNLFYDALEGHPLRCPVAVATGEDWSCLRVHAEFSTYFFLPFYALRPRAETLLCIQAFTVGLGAVPIYLIAEKRLPRVAALVLGGAYLLFAPAHAGNFYDFHFQPLASTLILWSFYFLDANKNVLFAIAFAVALGCREDMSLSFAIAGVLMVGTGYRPLAGVIVATLSVVYFGVMRFVVMPKFGGWWFQNMYKDLLPEGDASLLGVARTVVSNPLYTLGTLLKEEKLLHVLQIFLPLAFLPLRRPWLWLGFVPALLGTLLTTGYHPTTDTTFQYVFYWVPFIFVGAAVVLEGIRATRGALRQAAAVAAMALATLLASYHWGVVFQHETFASAWGHIDLGPLTPAEQLSLRDLRELGDMVPKEASFALTEQELPHFSNRFTVYALRDGANDADYVLFRTGSGDRRGAEETLASQKYDRIASKGEFVLLKKKSAPP